MAIVKVQLKPEISTVTSLEMLRQVRHRAVGKVLLYHCPHVRCLCFTVHPDVEWLIRNWDSALAGVTDRSVGRRARFDA